MRLRLGIAVLALVCAVLAACTNSTTGGSTLPGGQMQPLQNPITPSPQPTRTPDFATGNVIVAGDGKAIPLNAPGDFKVSAVFPKSAASPMPSPITLSATVSVPGPPGIPKYGPKTKKGFLFTLHHTVTPALLYVWFSSDKGATISSLPTLDFTVPLSALEEYGTDPTLHLAIYDPANESKWTHGIARRSDVTPAPSPSGSVAAAVTATATPTATPTPTPTPTPTLTVTPIPRPGQPFGATPPVLATPRGGLAPGIAQGPRATVPTMQLRFLPAQRAMKLLPKKPLVFVLYAEPASSAEPSATAKSSAKPSASSTASPAASTSASPSASPSAAPSSSASASPAPSPSST